MLIGLVVNKALQSPGSDWTWIRMRCSVIAGVRERRTRIAFTGIVRPRTGEPICVRVSRITTALSSLRVSRQPKTLLYLPTEPPEVTMRKLPSLALRLAIFLALAVTAMAQTLTAEGYDSAQAEKRFSQLCSGCHGQNGTGGDPAPALTNNRALRTSNESQIAELIKNGTPGGMPAFPLPQRELSSMAHWVRSLNLSAFDTRPPGDTIAAD